MERGLTSSVIGLMAISVLVLSFIYLRPVELEQSTAPIYGFIEKIDEKKQVMRHLASKAIAEAFADSIFDQMKDAGYTCPSGTPFEAEPAPIEQKLTHDTNGYLTTINNMPENYPCTITLDENNLTPFDPNVGQSIHGQTLTATVSISCKAETQDQITGVKQEFVKVTKKYTFTKNRPDIGAGFECYMFVTDLNSSVPDLANHIYIP